MLKTKRNFLKYLLVLADAMYVVKSTKLLNRKSLFVAGGGEGLGVVKMKNSVK